MRISFVSAAILAVLTTGCSLLPASRSRFDVEKRWARHTIQKEYLEGKRLHRFQPILHDEIVITGNSVDGLVAYRRDDAKEMWRFSIKDGVEGGAYLAEDVLYFGSGDGQFYALEVETGKPLWTYSLKAEGIAKPLVRGDMVYVLGGNNVAHALSAKTGKLIWVYNRREASNISIRGGSQPAIAGDLVLIGFSDGSLVALNKNSGSVVWEANLNRNKRFRDVDATPVVDGDAVYISSYDGALYALNKTDGRILWTVDDGGYDEVLIQGSTLYYASSNGKIMALDKGSGKVLWSHDNPHGISVTPAAFKNVLLVGEMDGGLRFLDSRNGDLLTTFEPGWGVTSRSTIDPKKGEVYFMSMDANLYALRIGWRRFGRGWPWD